MPAEEWALIASVVFAGLWAGLTGMLTLVMHPMLKAMDGPGVQSGSSANSFRLHGSRGSTTSACSA